MKRKDIKSKIKEYFFINPTEKLRVRQIERVLNIPLPSVIRYTKELEKEGILKVISVAEVNMYTADRVSSIFLLEKKLFNVKLIYSSGIIDLIIKEHDNPTIVLFGSFAKGEDVEKSDIDLYIETMKKNISLEQFEKKLDRKIQIFCFKKINEIKNKELANNILNGVVINGFLEVF